jgi:hypothetical protein
MLGNTFGARGFASACDRLHPEMHVEFAVQTADVSLDGRQGRSYRDPKSMSGRTSTLPIRAGGIFEASRIASFRSRASIR